MASGSRDIKKTSLNGVHHSLGGHLVDFSGWEMPLWYKTGAVREHLAVVNSAGLFDTGHMSVIMARGPGIMEFLNYALTRDLRALKPGRAGYSVILDKNGFSIDDAIVYPLAEDRYGLVLNAGMAGPVIEHLKSMPGANNLIFSDLTGQLAKIDIQGPASFRIFRKFVSWPERVFAGFPYFSFKGDFDLRRSEFFLADHTPALLSRSGYTGELGFEIFVAEDKAGKLWNDLLEAGAPEGLTPCGLAARDSLRAGAVLPLSHQDIGPWPYINNPWPWALPFDQNGRFSKDFLGRMALDPLKAEHTLPFAGFDPRKVDRHEAVVLFDGSPIGKVLTAVADMAIGRFDGNILSLNSPEKPLDWMPKGLVCGFVKVDRVLPEFTEIILKDTRRELKAEIRSDIRPCRSARWPLN